MAFAPHCLTADRSMGYGQTTSTQVFELVSHASLSAQLLSWIHVVAHRFALQDSPALQSESWVHLAHPCVASGFGRNPVSHWQAAAWFAIRHSALTPQATESQLMVEHWPFSHDSVSEQSESCVQIEMHRLDWHDNPFEHWASSVHSTGKSKKTQKYYDVTGIEK